MIAQKLILLYRKIKPCLSVRSAKKLYAYCIIIGVLAGLAALAFSWGLAHAESFFISRLGGYSMHHPDNEFSLSSHVLKKSSEVPRPLFVFIPALGAFLSGILSYFFCREAGGIGTDALIDTFHQQDGKMKPRVPLIKAAATICTLGSGGSAGKEGPIAQIGAGLGSLFAQICGLGARARRSLLLAGAAGGLGAIFRAPLGGAITAIEVIYREDFETDSLVPCLISSITAYITYCSVVGFKPLFYMNNQGFPKPVEFIFYAILSFVCVGVGALYVRIFHYFHKVFFPGLRLHPLLKPLAGGLLVGIICYLFPENIGSGFGFIQKLSVGRIDMPLNEIFRLVVILFFLKIISTSLTLGSGGSGGVFAPSLVIGGLLGGAVGILFQILFPGIIVSYVPFIVTGMAAFFAGIAHAPVATLIMVAEMTGSYSLLPQLLLITVITVMFAPKHGIYQGQIVNQYASPAHIWNINIDLLRNLKISEILEKGRLSIDHPMMISASLKYNELKKISVSYNSLEFIVVNNKKQYIGNINLNDAEKHSDKNLPIGEFASPRLTLSINNDLRTAAEYLLSEKCELLAVIEEGIVSGVLDYRTLLEIYNEETKGYTARR